MRASGEQGGRRGIIRTPVTGDSRWSRRVGCCQAAGKSKGGEVGVLGFGSAELGSPPDMLGADVGNEPRSST